jgi:hypothetical protein
MTRTGHPLVTNDNKFPWPLCPSDEMETKVSRRRCCDASKVDADIVFVFPIVIGQCQNVGKSNIDPVPVDELLSH